MAVARWCWHVAMVKKKRLYAAALTNPKDCFSPLRRGWSGKEMRLSAYRRYLAEFLGRLQRHVLALLSKLLLFHDVIQCVNFHRLTKSSFIFYIFVSRPWRRIRHFSRLLLQDGPFLRRNKSFFISLIAAEQNARLRINYGHWQWGFGFLFFALQVLKHGNDGEQETHVGEMV